MPQGEYLPEGYRLNRPENRAVAARAALEQAAAERRLLEGVVSMCDAAHNLIVDFNGFNYPPQRSSFGVGKRRNPRDRRPFPGWQAGLF